MQVVHKSALLQSLISLKNDIKLIELAKDKFSQGSMGQTMQASVSKTGRTDHSSPKK